MKEAIGNLWDFKGVKCITTNGFVKANGSCVMGRGCAKEAMIKYPKLPFELGKRIKKDGNHVFLFPQYDWGGIITFPVKHNWWEKADIALIERSAEELMNCTKVLVNPIYLPRPGCGNGNLKWEDVRKVLKPILSDQIIVIDF